MSTVTVMSLKQIEEAIMSDDQFVTQQLIEVIAELEKASPADTTALKQWALSPKWESQVAPIFSRNRKQPVVIDLTVDDD